MYRYIEPEVAGGLGHKTIINNNIHPPVVKRLNYEFNRWLGDDILESFPCYIVSKRLKDGISSCRLSGIIFSEVKVTKSENFIPAQSNVRLPDFYWLQIIGKKNTDDFFIAEDFRLIISEQAFVLLQKYNIVNATFIEVE